MEYVIILESSFLKCYDFKHEGIWEICLSGTQLDNLVQNISHSNLLLIGTQKSASVLLESTRDWRIASSLSHVRSFTYSFFLCILSCLEIKEMVYIKPSWESEVFTEFTWLIKLRFLEDQGQMTEYKKIFPLISRFFFCYFKDQPAGSCRRLPVAPPLPTMRGSWWKNNFQGSATELCEHLRWLALPRPDGVRCLREK